jgi:hypothetical protein
MSVEKVEKYDWRSKIKEAAAKHPEKVVRLSSKVVANQDWRFSKIIGDAVGVVEDEQKAQRAREAAEKERLDKARDKAMAVRDQVILPLLNDLRDHFAAARKNVLPEWRVDLREDANRFLAEAATPAPEAGDSMGYSILAEASLDAAGEFINFSVACSATNPKITSAAQVASLYNKAAKFRTVLKLDEDGSRMWFHRQLSECAKMCIYTQMRQH